MQGGEGTLHSGSGAAAAAGAEKEEREGDGDRGRWGRWRGSRENEQERRIIGFEYVHIAGLGHGIATLD